MSILCKAINLIPRPVLKVLKPIYGMFACKTSGELLFWRSRHEMGGGTFQNSYYKDLMLAMAEKPSDEFLKGKIVADFGCGPRGSLVWAKSAALRIGIDVLADKYADYFKNDIVSHGMIYLRSTEKVIPLPADWVDVMFTLNAIDHVTSFETMCREIIRVIKPGGNFIGSFNLEEPPTLCEPQTLNEKRIKENLLDYLEIKSYRVTKCGPANNPYGPFFDNNLINYKTGQRGFLWVVATKPATKV